MTGYFSAGRPSPLDSSTTDTRRRVNGDDRGIIIGVVEEWIRGQRCPVCNGRRGKVIARIRDTHTGYVYERFTHRVYTALGVKRKYCYRKLGTPDPS